MRIHLPENIDYTKYHGTSGCSTKLWGKAGWTFLFSSIIGNYPVKLNKSKQHQLIKHHYKNLFSSLAYTMPCIYCRNSFKQFMKQIPINNFLIGRIELMYWLYLVKDLVNKKLIKQEKKCYNDEKKRLKNLYYSHKITQSEYYQQVEKFKTENSYTIPTPPFEEILDHFESFRAVCSNKAQKCLSPT